MKKIIAIGDIHGENLWEPIAEQKADLFVFIGDYFDSWYQSGDEQVANFNKILAFKKANPEKVVLLIGNHELHYLSELGEKYSGYQAANAARFNDILTPLIADGTLQAVHTEPGLLFSHAGVTTTWCRNQGITGFEAKPLALIINDMFIANPKAFCFYKGDSSGTGNNVNQGPLWVRPEALLIDKIEIYTQVVGHTTHDHVTHQKGVYFIDALRESDEYLQIVGKKITIKKLTT